MNYSEFAELMGDAFDPLHANFSGIAQVSQAERIYISKVKHKTFAEVNEGGTVAAAVTAVEVQLTSAPPTREFHHEGMSQPEPNTYIHPNCRGWHNSGSFSLGLRWWV